MQVVAYGSPTCVATTWTHPSSPPRREANSPRAKSEIEWDGGNITQNWQMIVVTPFTTMICFKHKDTSISDCAKRPGMFFAYCRKGVLLATVNPNMVAARRRGFLTLAIRLSLHHDDTISFECFLIYLWSGKLNFLVQFDMIHRCFSFSLRSLAYVTGSACCTVRYTIRSRGTAYKFGQTCFQTLAYTRAGSLRISRANGTVPWAWWRRGNLIGVHCLTYTVVLWKLKKQLRSAVNICIHEQ